MPAPWLNANAPRLPVETDAPALVLRAGIEDDPRLGDLVGRDLGPGRGRRRRSSDSPTDEGVRRNGGRVGAAQAPDRIRHWFYRLTPGRDPRVLPLLTRMHDFGNLRIDADLEAAQARLGEAVAACLAHDTFPIVLGGGHETALRPFPRIRERRSGRQRFSTGMRIPTCARGSRVAGTPGRRFDRRSSTPAARAAATRQPVCCRTRPRRPTSTTSPRTTGSGVARRARSRSDQRSLSRAARRTTSSRRRAPRSGNRSRA